MVKSGLLVFSLLLASIAVGLDQSAGQAGSDRQPRVLVFLCQRMFREEALNVLVKELVDAGCRVDCAAPETTIAVGMNRTVFRPGLALREARVEDFAAFVLIGGSGVVVCWDDTVVHARCQEFSKAGKLVASIGLANICLARAGVLQGRWATIFPDRRAVAELTKAGARYRHNPVVTDRNIITASETRYARRFAQAVVQELSPR